MSCYINHYLISSLQLYTLFDDLDQEFSNLARNTREHRKDGTNTHIISEKTLKKILNTAGELYKFIEKYRSSPLLWEVLDLNQPRVNWFAV